MNNYISTVPLYDSVYLAHHGIKGQKWGIRRYQNEDGTLTEEGLKRYGLSDISDRSSRVKALNRLDSDRAISQYHSDYYKNLQERYNQKIAKKQSKNKSTKNIEKKLNRVTSRKEAYDKMLDESIKTIDHIMDVSEKNNENIKTAFTTRSVMTTGEKLTSAALAMASASMIGYGSYTDYVDIGIKYS